jgi:hypothetical protein
MELKNNVPYEVTRTQYNMVRNEYGGVCAHRTENGRYWIKLLLINYLSSLKLDLNGSN